MGKGEMGEGEEELGGRNENNRNTTRFGHGAHIVPSCSSRSDPNDIRETRANACAGTARERTRINI